MATSTWAFAFTQRPEDNRRKIVQILHNIEGAAGFGHYITANLVNDRFLCRDAVEKFLDLLLAQHSPIDYEDFGGKYVCICHKHSLCGDEIGLAPYPALLGRAVDREEFKSRITRILEVTPERANEIAELLERSEMTDTDWDQVTKFQMADHGTWVTWDRDSRGVDRPFAFLRDDNPVVLRNALGLAIDHPAVFALPLLGFEYSSKVVGMLRKPTTADAAESLRFTVTKEPPPEENDWYGLTTPWQENRGGGGSSDYDRKYPPRRPEALHEPIRFSPEVICKRYPRISIK